MQTKCETNNRKQKILWIEEPSSQTLAMLQRNYTRFWENNLIKLVGSKRNVKSKRYGFYRFVPELYLR